ncbi:hypothetical protein RJ639_035839, partial [Escallonia herrerae]
MMGSYNEAEEDEFYDASDEIASRSDIGSDCSEDCPRYGIVECESNELGYKVWTKNPESVHERRRRLLKWMGLSSDWNVSEKEELRVRCNEEIETGISRLRDSSKCILANSDCEDRFLSSQSYRSCRSTEALESVEADDLGVNLTNRVRNLDDQAQVAVDELGQNRMLPRLGEKGSNQIAMVDKLQRSLDSSSVQKFLRREDEASKFLCTRKKVKRGWMQKLNVMAKMHRHEGATYPKAKDFTSEVGSSIRTVRVHPHRKRAKELSSLYAGQEFPAHHGSILAMKFSPDGQYLASAGEDSIVRVWRVVEDERPSTFDIQNADPSCLYFSLNHLSKLAPVNVEKGMIGELKRMKKSSDSACVIFPPKLLRIMEKPVHEFHGHSNEVLALAWSKKGCLLSSSVDKTVRLWKVGCDQCLRVFSHNNYVTCIDFNPVDDNYFISGSIDGKVRFWEVHGCHVIDWIDIREIVTAVCFFPDGKGCIVGSMDGNCRFYDIIGNRLQPGAQICLQGKKKLPGKRITGFQFCPCDPTKVMVTSADSQVRILCNAVVICKYKGVRSSGSQMSASFTSDGKHIFSVAEDSNVFMWNYNSQDRTSSRARTISSCESFLSDNASIVIPWCGTKSMPSTLPSPSFSGDNVWGNILSNGQSDEDSRLKLPLPSPDCFSLNRGFFLEALHRGSATWPEEKLPSSSSMCKSEYKFLKTAYQSTFNSPHMWGHVTVTAGWDGQIRTYLNYGLPTRLSSPW